VSVKGEGVPRFLYSRLALAPRASACNLMTPRSTISSVDREDFDCVVVVVAVEGVVVVGAMAEGVLLLLFLGERGALREGALARGETGGGLLLRGERGSVVGVGVVVAVGGVCSKRFLRPDTSADMAGAFDGPHEVLGLVIFDGMLILPGAGLAWVVGGVEGRGIEKLGRR